MKNLRYWLLGFGVLVSLAGCGGGGGGGAAANVFQNWPSIAPPTTIEIGAISQDVSYVFDQTPPFDDNGVSTSASATIEYRSDGSIERIDITTPSVSLLWNELTGDSITGDDAKWIILIDSFEEDIGIAVNPVFSTVEWEYQTFGAWESGRGTLDGNIGGISMGAPTAADAIPVVGAAVDFTGDTTGIYIDGSNDYYVFSTLNATVDFTDAGGPLFTTFESTDARKVSVADVINGSLVTAADTNLNFAGSNITYSAITNTFTGDISGVGLTGTTTGQFYGPAAQELGGVFSLTDNALNPSVFYTGAYGAARP